MRIKMTERERQLDEIKWAAVAIMRATLELKARNVDKVVKPCQYVVKYSLDGDERTSCGQA